MKYYARFIRKLQLEMGIRVTHFDLDILDGETIWKIEQEVKAIEAERKKEIDNGSSDLTVNDSAEEREYNNDNDYDYDVNMNNVALNKNIPSPREEIFHSFDTNSCKYPPNPGEAIVQKRVSNRNFCPYSLYDSGAEFENPDHEQIKQDIINSESQNNSHSPWTDDSSLETNMSLSQDDGDLESDDAIENSDPNSYEGSPVADDGMESENELPVQVTGYGIRYDRAMRYSPAEHQTADYDNKKTEKKNLRSCQYIPRGRANQGT